MSTAEGPHREAEGVHPVGDPVERRRARAAGRGSRLLRRARLEQVEDRRDAAQGEGAGGDDRRRPRGSPASRTPAPRSAARRARRATSTSASSTQSTKPTTIGPSHDSRQRRVVAEEEQRRRRRCR